MLGPYLMRFGHGVEPCPGVQSGDDAERMLDGNLSAGSERTHRLAHLHVSTSLAL